MTLEFRDSETLNGVSIIAGVMIADAALTLGSDTQVTFVPGYEGISAATTLTNYGAIGVPDVLLSDTYDSLAAPVFINAGEIAIGANNNVNITSDGFENQGYITIGGGGILSISLQSTLSDLPGRLGTIDNQGGTYAVTLIGTIDNGGTTFDSAIATAESVTTFAGLLLGGSLTASDGNLDFAFGTTLDGVTVLGPMELSASDGNINFLDIQNGLTLTGPDGSGPGSDIRKRLRLSDVPG